MSLTGQARVSVLGIVVALLVFVISSLPTRVDAEALCNVGNGCTFSGFEGACGAYPGQGGICMCYAAGQEGQYNGCQRVILNPPPGIR